RIEQLLRRERLAGNDVASRIELRDRHARAIGLGEEDEGVSLEAQRLGIRRVGGSEALVGALGAERRLSRALNVEVNAEHRRVIAIDRSLVDLDARREGFGEREFVGEESRHIDESLRADRRTGKRHLEVADCRREKCGQARLAADVSRARNVGVRHLQNLVDVAGCEKQPGGGEGNPSHAGAPHNAIDHQMSLSETLVVWTLEPEIETNRVVPNVRLAKELIGAEVEPAVLVDLRIEPGVVRPRLQVAAGEGERGGVEAETRSEARHIALRNAYAQ